MYLTNYRIHVNCEKTNIVAVYIKNRKQLVFLTVRRYRNVIIIIIIIIIIISSTEQVNSE